MEEYEAHDKLEIIMDKLTTEGLEVTPINDNTYSLGHPDLNAIPITHRNKHDYQMTLSEMLRWKLDLLGNKILDATIEKYSDQPKVVEYLTKQKQAFFNPERSVTIGQYEVNDIKGTRQNSFRENPELLKEISEKPELVNQY